MRLAQPVTKWAAEVSDIRWLPEMVEQAYRVATTGRPGPVHLSLPSDLLESSVDEDEIRFPAKKDWREVDRNSFDGNLASEAEALLMSARRPAVIAGSGAFWYRAGPAIRQLVEKMRLPLFTIESARGLVSDDHPCCFGYADPLLNPIAEKLAEADVVLLVGKKLDFRLRYGQMFADDAKLIQVDADQATIGGNRQPAVGLAGHPVAVIEQFLERPAGPTSADPGWLAELEAARNERRRALVPGLDSSETPVHPSAPGRSGPRGDAAGYGVDVRRRRLRPVVPDVAAGQASRFLAQARSNGDFGMLDTLRDRGAACASRLPGDRIGRRRRCRLSSDGVRYRR